jgi:hypothetical protein
MKGVHYIIVSNSFIKYEKEKGSGLVALPWEVLL